MGRDLLVGCLPRLVGGWQINYYLHRHSADKVHLWVAQLDK